MRTLLITASIGSGEEWHSHFILALTEILSFGFQTILLLLDVSSPCLEVKFEVFSKLLRCLSILKCSEKLLESFQMFFALKNLVKLFNVGGKIFITLLYSYFNTLFLILINWLQIIPVLRLFRMSLWSILDHLRSTSSAQQLYPSSWYTSQIRYWVFCAWARQLFLHARRCSY